MQAKAAITIGKINPGATHIKYQEIITASIFYCEENSNFQRMNSLNLTDNTQWYEGQVIELVTVP